MTGVVLMSGGLDSCVTAALAGERCDRLAALHVRYGQRTQRREERAFGEVCDALGITLRQVIDIGHLRLFGGSALTDPSIPVPEAEDLDRPGIPISYVPQRNGNLLLIAAAWAEVLGAEEIWAGMVEADAVGYPDCRREFLDALERAIGLGNHDDSPDPVIVTPLICRSKADIVRDGLRLGAPLERTWSCYQDEQAACGLCDSCQLRLKGFREAGAEDRIPYRQRV